MGQQRQSRSEDTLDGRLEGISQEALSDTLKSYEAHRVQKQEDSLGVAAGGPWAQACSSPRFPVVPNEGPEDRAGRGARQGVRRRGQIDVPGVRDAPGHAGAADVGSGRHQNMLAPSLLALAVAAADVVAAAAAAVAARLRFAFPFLLCTDHRTDKASGQSFHRNLDPLLIA